MIGIRFYLCALAANISNGLKSKIRPVVGRMWHFTRHFFQDAVYFVFRIRWSTSIDSMGTMDPKERINPLSRKEHLRISRGRTEGVCKNYTTPIEKYTIIVYYITNKGDNG